MGWKDWSYTKKGGIIGLAVSAFYILSGGLGTFLCGWNPVESSVIKSGLCSNTAIIIAFYVPLLFVLIYPLIGMLMGYIFGKFRTKGYSNLVSNIFVVILLMLTVLLLYITWMFLASI